MDKILFLDVDGPLIPAGQYFININCSWQRHCSPICIAVVNKICEKSGCKIVMNSSHSHEKATRQDLVREGINDEYFHDAWRTPYPYGYNFVTRESINRYDAIQMWMNDNGKVDWVALDDCPFLEDKDHPDFERLVWIDFTNGLTPDHFNKVAKLWKFKPFIILG